MARKTGKPTALLPRGETVNDTLLSTVLAMLRDEVKAFKGDLEVRMAKLEAAVAELDENLALQNKSYPVFEDVLMMVKEAKNAEANGNQVSRN